MAVHELARQCGLRVPEAKLETFSGTGSTFLVKRFDRAGRHRVHFASAMTLLGKTDGASGTDGSSYLDIADFIRAHGASPGEDLPELWRRIVFGMAVSNTDDHLRNHGFLLSKKGWILSPLYDVNPSIYGNALSLNVTETDNSIDFELAVETAPFYGITHSDAKAAVEEISRIVGGSWRKAARECGLSRGAVEYMEPAFDMAFK